MTHKCGKDCHDEETCYQTHIAELESRNAVLVEALEKIASPLAFPLQSSGDLERRMQCAKEALREGKDNLNKE